MTDTDRKDVYSRVTARIIADLEQGVRPWIKPWSAGNTEGRVTLPLRANGTPYRGINVLMLWSQACAFGYAAPFWMTYRQAQELGAQVRKGEKGALVVYADRIRRTEQDQTGAEVERDIPFLKAYTVFNVEQIDNLPPHYTTPVTQPLDPIHRIVKADSFVAGTRADIRHGGGMACYVKTSDEVQMPPFESFRDAESYYATLAHELTHWTMHPSRLDRDLGRKRWGDEGYAQEELVAELGSAFLAADLGLYLEPREDHAAYIAHWIKILEDDRRAIFSAAAHAQRAVDFLHALQPPARPPA